MKYLLPLILSVFLSTTSLNAVEIAPDSCKGTLTGAVEGPFTCLMIAGFGFSPGVGAVSFTPIYVPTIVHALTVGFQMQGPPQKGNLTELNCDDCSAVVTLNDGRVFEMSKKNSIGKIEMELSESSVLFPGPKGTMYTVHGKIEADLVQTKPETTNATVHMSSVF